MITKKEYNYVVNTVFFKESPYIAYGDEVGRCYHILMDCLYSLRNELDFKIYKKREILKMYKDKYNMNTHTNNKAFCIMLSYIVNKYSFKIRVDKKLGEKVFKIF